MLSVDGVREKVTPTPAELQEAGFKQEGEKAYWSKDTSIDADFTQQEMTILKDIVDKLNKEGEIDMNCLSICRKIKEV